MSEAGAEGLVAELRAACVGHPDATIAWPHRILHRAADALEAQGRALAELRAENERKTRDIEVKARILTRMAKAVTGAERQRDEALEALRPFARIAEIFDHIAGNRPREGEVMSWVDHRVGERALTVEALRHARSVLENGPAGLADATPEKSPSSQDQEIAGLRAALETALEILREASNHTSGPLFLRIVDGITALREAKWAAHLSPLDGEA